MSGHDETDRTRRDLETSKQRAIVFREWAYFVMAGLFCLMLIWALWSWKQANDMWGASQAKLNLIIDGFADKVNAVDTEQVNTLTSEATLAIADLRTMERELTGLAEDTRRNTTRLANAAAERLERLQENLDSVRAVTDETAGQIRTMSKATTVLMEKYGATAEEATKAIRDASLKTGKSLDELARQVSDPRWGRAADNLLKTAEASTRLVDESTALIKDVHVKANETMAEMPGIAKDVHKTTTNISKFSKVTIITSIISRLAAAFIPGLY